MLLAVFHSSQPSLTAFFQKADISFANSCGHFTCYRHYPGSRLSFLSGSAIKRIKVGVKALFADSSAKIRSANLSLHPPVKLASNEKEYRFALLVANPSLGALAGFLAFPVQVVGERRAAPDNPIRSPHRYAPACLPSA